MTNPEISFPSTREKLPVHLPSLPAEQKTPVFSESQSGRQELSNEYLQKVTNNDFLKVDFEKRLQYLTSPKVNFNEVRVWKTQNIRFTFTFDWKFNRELFMKTTAWQVLPPEINEIKVWNTLYTRYWLKWEFFSWNNRLIIKEWTEIEIPKTRTKEEFTEIEKANETSYNEIIKTNPQADTSIIKESISRWIDPKFALLAFWKRYKQIPENEKKSVLEDMMTEFDRVRGKVQASNIWWNNDLYDENLAINLFKKLSWENWKEQAKEYGFSEEKIDNFVKISQTKIDFSLINTWDVQAMIITTAKTLEIKPQLIQSILKQESNGDMSATRFEKHVYDRELRKWVSEEEARLLATSFWWFQIMGFNYKVCWYETVFSYVEAMKSEEKQFQAFVNFIKSDSKLYEAMKWENPDFSTIAYHYNGPMYAQNDYDAKIKNYFQALA